MAAPVVINRRRAAATRVREATTTSRAVATNAKKSAFASLYALPEGEISSYACSFFSSDEIVAMSVMEITVENESTSGNIGTSTDPRLGAVRKSELCATCSLPSLEDSGHYGYIKLNCHLINPTDECRKVIILVFKSLCDRCGKPMVNRVDSRKIFSSSKSFVEKLTDLAAQSESYKCTRPGVDGHTCGGTAFELDNKSAAFAGYLGDMSLDKAYKILNNLTAEDLEDIGYTEKPGPIALIMRVFPVIPHRNRMAARTNYGDFSNSLITKQYDIILSRAEAVQKAVGEQRNDEMKKLSKAIEDMYTKPGLYKKSLTSKEHGIIRNMLEGKTITCSSRMVIVPAPDVPVTHGIIPSLLARTTTIRETVTESNIEMLKDMMKNGKIKTVYPGSTGHNDKIKVQKDKIYTINIGDRVDRDILEGDKSIFDRPPTLHEAGVVPVSVTIDKNARISYYDNDGQPNIFAEIIRNNEGYVIGLHLGQTVAKAADYDGDEDATLFPQHEDARDEMDGIQHLENYMIDGQDQKVAFAPVQDALLGCYVATKYSLPVNWRNNHKRKYTADDLLSSVELMEKYTYLSKERFLDFLRMLDDPLVNRTKPYRTQIIDDDEINGKVTVDQLNNGDLVFSGEFIDNLGKNGVPFLVDGVIPAVHLLSLILPETLTYENKSISIKNGIITRCESASNQEIGNSQLGLIAHIVFNNSRAEAVNFVTDATWIFTSFNSFRGFSIGIGDNLPPTAEIQKQLDRKVVRMYERLEYVQEPTTDDRIEIRKYEHAYSSATEDATNGSRSVIDSTISPDNGLLTIITSGAKGKKEQLYNLVATGGQKYETGKIAKKVLTNGTRRCYYYHAEDTDPVAHGYVASSYSKGVNSVESDFIQKNTRSDFIVMSQDTPIVGQASREICTVNIGIVIGNEGEIRDSVGMISPTFAADNFNPMRLTRTLRPDGSKKISLVNIQRMAKQISSQPL